MIRFCILVCLLHPAIQDPNPGILKEVVSKGWEEHKLPRDKVEQHLKNIIYSGITLTDSAVASSGSMRVTKGPEYKKTKFAFQNSLEAVHDDLKIVYNYTLDTGKKGHVNVEVTNRTYSMRFQSMLGGGKDCLTALLYIKLTNEGPVGLTVKGDKAAAALKIVEQIRYSIVLQSRSFMYFEIIEAMNERLMKHRPKLCSKETAENATHEPIHAGRSVMSKKRRLTIPSKNKQPRTHKKTHSKISKKPKKHHSTRSKKNKKSRKHPMPRKTSTMS